MAGTLVPVPDNKVVAFVLDMRERQLEDIDWVGLVGNRAGLVDNRAGCLDKVDMLVPVLPTKI